MRYLIATIFCCFSLLPVPGFGEPSTPSANLNVFWGYKLQTDSFFRDKEVDDHLEQGVLFDFNPGSLPVNFAIDYFRSTNTETTLLLAATFTALEVSSSSKELDIGIRKIWDHSPNKRPYIGGGLAIIETEFEETFFSQTKTDKDTGAGIWLNAGIYWTLGGHFNLGFDFRYSYAKITLLEQEVNAGGVHGGILAGVHF